jgi:hypothetical protein
LRFSIANFRLAGERGAFSNFIGPRDAAGFQSAIFNWQSAMDLIGNRQ